jgi:chemotaxis protein MotB
MKKGFVFSVVILFLMSGCVLKSTYDVKDIEAQALASENDDLKAQVTVLTAENDVLKKDRASLLKEKEALEARIEALTQKAKKVEQLEKTTQTYKDLQKKLQKEIREGQIQIKEMKDRLTMTMVDKIIFPSGSATISPAGKKVLDKVVSILKDVKDKRIQVEGHTDNVKIVSSLKKRFPTNWELSTARASEVVRYLQEKGGIDPKQLSATGYGEHQPVASNKTSEGRHKNRRIEIVLLPLLK